MHFIFIKERFIMTEIEAKSDGVVSKALDTIKQWADKFFGFLSKVATDVKDEYVNSKTKRRVFIDKETSLPMAVEFERISDDAGEMRVYININDSYKKNPVVYKDIPYDISNEDLDSFYKDAMKKLIKTLDDDDKGAFGIKTSREIQARLHKVVGKRETSIKLTGIKANFNISEANAIFADILDNDDFIEQLPEEPTDFEIVDIGDEYEISSIDQAQIDFMNEGFRTILCAAIKFNMAMQILHWQTYNDEKLFTITNDMLWQSQDCMNQFGMWVIEFDNEVTSAMISESCLSSFTAIETYEGPIGAEIKGAISEFVDTLNFEWPNFPHDIQNELDSRIRRMNETVDLGLRDY
jgi:hypothetical protein